METSAAQQKFVQLFSDYMVRHDAWKPLSAFIASLKFDDLRDCLSSYFDVSKRYRAADPDSLRVFSALASTALDRGDVYFALRFEVLVETKGTPWFERYGALDGGARSRLAAQLAKKKQALSWSQRKFLQLFDDAMRRKDERRLSDFVSPLKPPQVQECLYAYIEASTRFPDDDKVSLKIFFGVSFIAVNKGDSYFAAKYESLVKSAGTIWSARFVALDTWQAGMLRDAIAERKKAIKVAIAPERAESADTRKAAPMTSTQREFLNLFEQFRPPHDPKPVTEFVFRLRLPQQRECLAAYLDASTRLGEADQRYSLYIFFGLSSLVLEKGEAYDALKFEALVSTPGTLWATRYAELAQEKRQVLTGQIAKKRKDARVLDELKFAYFRKHQEDPDIKRLRAFEPVANDELRRMLRDVLGRCQQAFAVHRIADFLAAFDALALLFHAQKDTLTWFAMLKWCREASQLAPLIRNELYWYGVAMLYLYALPLHPVVYQGGFSEEETLFLLDLDSGRSSYFNDFQSRLDYVVYKKRGHTDLTEVSKAHAALMVFADMYGAWLVPMDEASGIRRLVETLRTDRPKSIDALRIPVNAPRFPNTKLTIGQTIGDIFIVWWDRQRSIAYIEIQGVERVLFAVDSYWKLGRIYEDDAVYGALQRGTEHLLVIIPAFFEVIGYLPDLVSGGFAGLVKSVIINYIASEIADRAFDGSTAANLITATVLGVLTHHGPKGEEAVRLLGDEARQVTRSEAGAAAKQVAGLGERLGPAAGPGKRRGGKPLLAAGDGGEAVARSEQQALIDEAKAKLRGVTPPSRMLPEGRISGAAKVTAEATGIEASQAQAIGDVVNKRFTVLPEFARAWNLIATRNGERIRAVQGLFESNLSKREIAKRARSLFGDLRKEFWTYVGTSNDLAARQVRDQLRHAGFTVAQDGTAPTLRIATPKGVYDFSLDLDHIAELNDAPVKAFSANNLRATPSRENRILLNQVHAQDPFQPDARLTQGRGTSRAGKLLGDPQYRGRVPKRGLLVAPGEEGLHEAVAADVQAAIDEALRRLEELGPEQPF